MRATVLLGMLAVAFPAIASEPGQPLDCSDWVFLEPGLFCTEFSSLGTMNSFVGRGVQREVDNVGALYTLRLACVAGQGCAQNDLGYLGEGRRVELLRLDARGEQVVAYVLDRPNPVLGTWDHIRLNGSACPHAGDGCPPWGGDIALKDQLSFDRVNGRLLVNLRSYDCTASSCAPGFQYDGWWIAAISGFATLYEIQQTYTPTAGPLSFRVPAIPEGLPAADYFDTYYGDLATVGDWSQAQPLQCGYPASPPSVGDYLEVADPLPNPDPGHGRYYVTAVHYQGQTRYGRRSDGGVLSGRDPAVLPACGE